MTVREELHDRLREVLTQAERLVEMAKAAEAAMARWDDDGRPSDTGQN